MLCRWFATSLIALFIQSSEILTSSASAIDPAAAPVVEAEKAEVDTTAHDGRYKLNSADPSTPSFTATDPAGGAAATAEIDKFCAKKNAKTEIAVFNDPATECDIIVYEVKKYSHSDSTNKKPVKVKNKKASFSMSYNGDCKETISYEWAWDCGFANKSPVGGKSISVDPVVE